MDDCSVHIGVPSLPETGLVDRAPQPQVNGQLSSHNNMMNGGSDDDVSLDPWPPLITPPEQQDSDSSITETPPGTLHDPPTEDGDLTINKASKSSSTTTLILPRMNVPERIIICLDLQMDPNPTLFRLGCGTLYTPLAMMKRVIQIFLYNKQLLNKGHKFALMLLNKDDCTWIVEFTDDPKELISIFSGLEDSRQDSVDDEFDMSALFGYLKEHVSLPTVDNPSRTPPPYVVRVVLLYARSHCMPRLSNPEHFIALKRSPYFFLDLLYLHEPLTGPTKVSPEKVQRIESVFNVLTRQMCLDSSYVYNVARNPTKLHDCMSKLLAHPLQRPAQEDADYKLLTEDS